MGYFQDLFFPPACLHCEKVLSEQNELSLCADCFKKLRIMPADFPEPNILRRLQPCFIDQIWIAYQFDEVIQSVIHSVKYRKMPQMGVTLGKYTARELNAYFEQTQEKIFLPVPLHPIRQKERGFNQSEYIAKGIMHTTAGTFLKDCLHRSKNTISQTNLNREERHQNVDSAFHVKTAAAISGKSIFLVDDLITTGATINECARVLKENGVEKVTGVAVASPVIFTDS